MLLGIVLVVAVTNASAQDLIVLNSDAVEEMQVKVVEVSDSEVKYKKWSYQDGDIKRFNQAFAYDGYTLRPIDTYSEFTLIK